MAEPIRPRRRRNRKTAPLVPRLFSKIEYDTNGGCWLWAGTLNPGGYGVVNIKRRVVLAHRAFWEALRGPIPAGLNGLHRCDVRCCVNPDHIFLGTLAENNDDMRNKGRARWALGVESASAKLTPDAVRTIRWMRARGATLMAIADCFGVTHQSVAAILNGKTWRHI